MCGEALVRLLERYGVDTVFGIPGVHTVEMYRALAASPIRHVSPRHEQGAGFMADGYARASGRPGVCFIITGPGMTNIATAMGQAYADSIPMLVISAVGRRHQLGLGHGHLHELPDQRGLVAGLCAFSHTLMRAAELPEVVARAFAVFASARPRPVHIEIPLDVLTEDAGDLPLDPRPAPSPPGADPAAIAAAAARLARAPRTVLLAGGGAIAAAPALRRLAETLGAPVFLTNNARGLLPPDHPLLLCGAISRPAAQAFLGEADAVLAVGTELGETDYDFSGEGRIRLDAPLLRIDIDPLQVAGAHPAAIGIVADARLAAEALAAALEAGDAGPRDRGWAVSGVARLNAEALGRLDGERRAMHAVLETIRTSLGDPIIVGDSTKPVYQGMETYRAAAPRGWFTSSTGYGTLGYAVPAAIGARIAAPDRPVVALIGDGGAQFTAPELLSAREAETAVAFLVWNNAGYVEIRDFMDAAGVAPVGVDIAAPDFQALAAAMGLPAIRVTTLAELRAALAGFAGAPAPILVEIDAAAMLRDAAAVA